MKRQRTLKSNNPANLRRQRDLARYAKRSNLRLEMLEPRLALYAATLDLLPTSDSGSSDSDNITNATIWDIRVDGVAVGANINLVQNGNVIATAQAQGTDTFVDFTLNSATVGAFSEGDVELVAADAANATDFTTPLTITKDTVADNFSTSSPTTGVQGQDVNYDLNNPEEGAGASYALVNSVESVVPAGATINASSGLLTWVPSDTQIGAFSFQILFTDVAGNTKTQNVDISIDPAAPGTPTLAAASDSGALATDKITNSNSLTISVTGIVDGATVNLYRDGTLLDSIATGTATTTFVVDLTGEADGNYVFTVEQEVAGKTSELSGALTVTRDTTTAALTSSPILTGAVGVAYGYNAAHAEEGDANFVYSLVTFPTGATIDPATGVVAWLPTLADVGTNAFEILVTDAAGNTNTQTFSVAIAPATLAAPDLRANSDSNIDNDNITSANSWNIDVNDIIAGATVRLYRNGTLLNTITSATATTTFVVDMTALADGTYAFTVEQEVDGATSVISPALSVVKDTTAPVDLSSTPPTTAFVGTLLTYDAAHAEENTAGFAYSLVQPASGATINATTGVLTYMPVAGDIGTKAFQIQVTDAAGNTHTQSFNVAVSVATPVAPATPDLQAGSDSGTSTDNLTNTTSWLIDVTGIVAGATVKLYHNATLLNTIAIGTATTTFTVDASAFAEGNHTFTAEQVVEGVTSPVSGTLTVVKDTTAPVAISTAPPTSGAVDTLLTYDPGHADEGTVGFVYSLVGAPAGATIVPETGVLTWTPGLADVGGNSFQIKVTDAAGNSSTQTLTIGIPPAVPSTPDLEAGSDSGLNTDNITKNTTWQINVAGLTVGTSVKLFRNGTLVETKVVTDTTMTFTVDATALADGNYNFTAQQDVDGVTSALTAALTITKDTTVPAAITSTPPVAAQSGVAYSYNVTHPEEGTGAITYSLAAGAPAGMTINATTGVVSWTPAANQLGTQNFQVQVTDIAGNLTAQSVSVVVTDPTIDVIDKVAFAKALTAAGVIFYGADWCVHCNATKALFEDGAQYLDFREVTNPDRSPNSVATANNITTYPTWVFPNGTRLTGEQTLEAISTAAGIAIPVGHTPSLAPLPNVTLLSDSPLNIPLNGFDPNGGVLTYEVSVSNPAVLSATNLSASNRSIKIIVNNFGTMILYLYEDEAPDVTAKFIAMINSNKFDSTIFHRVISGFMIQGGDPNGNGLNDENQPTFDDQFNLNLQHNQAGVLSMAKSGDDTNTSQFFITAAAARHLDFNHSVFGQVVEGKNVLAAINRTAVDGNDKPTNTVTIGDVQIEIDQENGMLRLKAAAGVTSGSSTVTVTVKDAQGNSAQQSFTATVASGASVNTPPFLGPIAQNPTLEQGVPFTIQLTSTDLQNNPVYYDIDPTSSSGKPYTATINNTTGLLTITPNTTFSGETSIRVRVRSLTPLNLFTGFDEYDSQLVTFSVNPAAPSSIDLLAASDSGISNTDNLTNATSWQFTVSGVTSGAVVKLMNGNTEVGSATVANGATSVLITIADTSVFGQGAIQLTAKQTIGGATSPLSQSITVTRDTLVPDAITSTAPTSVIAGQALNYNAAHLNEGQTGFVYSLVNAPAGATINSSTGVITWTPTTAQIGATSFVVQFADPAGNTVSQNINLSVLSDQVQLVEFTVDITDLTGESITSIEAGDDFYVNVYVADIRATAAGVFSAYTDLTYNQALVTAVGPLTYGTSFSNAQAGSITTPGLVDEAGATSGLSGLGSGGFLVYKLRFTATAAGNVAFATNPADDATFHPVLLFNVNSVIPNALVKHGVTSLTVNAATGAIADDFTVVEESGANTLNVLSNDSLPSGVTGTLTIDSITQPTTGGTVSISENGTRLVFTPAANFAGITTFTYTVTNGAGYTDTATVRMTVTDVNDPPTGLDDTFTVVEDAADTVLNVLSNDTFAPDLTDAIKVTAVSSGSGGGTITIGANGANIIYKPAANFNGTETFTYTITDNGGLTDTATVTMTVTAVNDNPVANNDTLTVAEDADTTVVNVLTNDTFAPDVGETLTVTAVTQGNKGGTVTFTNGGTTVSYKPAANFNGTETFTYTISDGNGGTATATVTVTATSVNDNPDAVNDTASIVKNTGPLVINVLSNDLITPDVGETLIVTAVTQGSNGGTITITSNGTGVNYTPAANFVGTETFTYTISDANGGTDTATVTVTVLDYIPSDVAGSVYIDANKNGVRDANEIGISGVTITLTGTGTGVGAVTLTKVTDSSGNYKFINLAPGTYTITQTQPSLMVDGPETIGAYGGTKPANDKMSFSFPENSHLVGYNFGEYGREARLVSVRDFFASTPTHSTLIAMSSAGTSQWITVDSSWTGVTSATATLNTARTEITLKVKDAAGAESQSVVPVNDTTRVQVVGGTNTSVLVRLFGSYSSFNFTSTASSSSLVDDESSGDSQGESNNNDAQGEPESANLPEAQGEPVSDNSVQSSDPLSSDYIAASLALSSSDDTSDDSTATSDELATSQYIAGADNNSTANYNTVTDVTSTSYIDSGSSSEDLTETTDVTTELEEATDSTEATAEEEVVLPASNAHDTAIAAWNDETWVDAVATSHEGESEEAIAAEQAAIDAALAEELWVVA